MGNVKSKPPRYVYSLEKAFKKYAVKMGYGDSSIHIMSIDDELLHEISDILPSQFEAKYKDNRGVKTMLITMRDKNANTKLLETLYEQIARIGYPPSEKHIGIIYRVYQL